MSLPAPERILNPFAPGAAPASPDVAFFIHTLEGGGAERDAVTLCNALAASGKSVHLIVNESEGAYWDALHPAIRIIHLPCRSMWRSVFPLRRYLRRCRPRRLASFLTEANAVAIAATLMAGRPCPVIVSERGHISYFRNMQKGRLRRLAYRLAPLLYHCADALICVSQDVADDVRRFVALPPHKILVINNPTLRPEVFALAKEELRHPWFAAGEPPVLLAVGRLSAEKNYPLLLDAFAQALKQRDARLLILGEGPQRPALEERARQLGIAQRLGLPGFEANPYACMSRAAGYVLCSDTEGLPNALIEALGCGCPVISTDCSGGVREILGGGRYGALVPTGDVAALAQALGELLANPQQGQASSDLFRREKLQAYTPEATLPVYFKAFGV